MVKQIRIVAVVLCQLFACFFAVSNGYCGSYGYIFSFDMKYIVLNERFEKVTEGDFKDELKGQTNDPGVNSVIYPAYAHKMFYNNENNQLFFLIAAGRANIYDGFLVTRINPLKYEPKYVAFLEKKMTMEMDVDLLFYNKDNKFFLSYYEVKKGDPSLELDYISRTEVHNALNFELAKEYSGTFFRINRKSCLIADRLYNGRLFNINTGEQIAKKGIPLGIPIYACKNGHVLAKPMTEIREPFKPLLVDIASEPISKKEINLNEKLFSFNPSDEWLLSNDAGVIIMDERKEKSVGKTGRLVFFDVNKGTQKEILVTAKPSAYNRILGFSLNGDLLFYHSENKVFVIDIKKQKLIKEFQIPFGALGIIWP